MNRGPSRGAVFALVIIIGLAAGAAYLFASGRIGSGKVSAEALDRVLVVAASPDEDGDVVGQIIAEVAVGEGSATAVPVSPALEVAIPGTSFATLGDAYPFGGGAGTAEAYSRAAGARAADGRLPYVALTPEQLAAAVEQIGGMRIEVPVSMSVFDGERLYSIKAGAQTLAAAELQAVLKGAPYIAAGERRKLDAELAAALVRVLGASQTLANSSLDTNLDAEALAKLRRAGAGTAAAK